MRTVLTEIAVTMAKREIDAAVRMQQSMQDRKTLSVKCRVILLWESQKGVKMRACAAMLPVRSR